MLCRLNWKGTCIIGLALLLAAPAVAEDVIEPGFDFWQTVGSGATGYSFDKDPIPAGFFCRDSEPFKGEVTFEGVPLKSDPDRALGTTDTIVERLDPAQFDRDGKATTRLRVRALRLEGRSTITNRCGEWAVKAVLAKGEQPITNMTLYRTNSNPDTGVFNANLVLDVEMVFENLSTRETVSLIRTVSLPTFVETPYAVGVLAEEECYSSAVPARASVYVVDGGFTVVSDSAFATGCYCNEEGECLPLTEQHEGPDEDHFVVPPCVFFGYACAVEAAVIDAIYVQMKDYYHLGVIDEDPVIATDMIVNKAF